MESGIGGPRHTHVTLDSNTDEEAQNLLRSDSFNTQTLSYDSKSRNLRQKHEQNKADDKERVFWEQTLNGTLFFMGALGMISISLMRFFDAESQSVHDVIMNFYFFFLGIVIPLT